MKEMENKNTWEIYMGNTNYPVKDGYPKSRPSQTVACL